MGTRVTGTQPLWPSARRRTSPVRAISAPAAGRDAWRRPMTCGRVGRPAVVAGGGFVDAVTSHTEQLDAGAGTVTPLRGVAPARGLPVALTSFVGRESELGQLHEVLRQARLVTLSGPGGCGKTRLALELAADLVDRTSGGVWWVDLAWLADARRVGAAVAEALGVRPLPGQTELQAACAYLAARRGLVVLDNCEHLLAGCAETVGALLKAAPARSRLGHEPVTTGGGGRGRLAGTADVVAGIGARPAGRWPVRTRWRCSSSARARRAPAFALSDGNAECVARVCAGVDGLPLAIELAAARLRMLSVEQIASGLGQRFRLLSGGPRTATQRQQTLHASVQWSHELLSRDERVLLRRFSVFAGGFTYEAAEQVCAFDAVERDRLLDLLASLVDQSLVLASEQGSVMRYRLQETMRQFARERLAEAGEEASLRCAPSRRVPGPGGAGGSPARDRPTARVAGAARRRSGQPDDCDRARAAHRRRTGRCGSALRCIGGGGRVVASPRPS